MQQKDPTRNWDTMIYLVAQASLRNVPNISFTIPDAYAVSYDIYGHTFLQYHGHDIKGWNSIPHYGIQRYTRNNNALRARTAKVIDYFLISHFHTDSAMPAGGGSNVFVNGSLIGGTELSMNVFGEMDVPKQKLLFVNQTVGVTSQWTVLGEVPHEKYTGTYTAKPWEHLD
jgi:hypothetical protein